MKLRHLGLVASLLAASAVACGSNDGVFEDDAGGVSDDDDTRGTSSCQALNWRADTPDAVTCPGADGCSCGGGDVCCLKASQDETRVIGASCSAETACADYAFSCDGPEDCATGDVCCFRGQGARCVADGECLGIDTVVLCRSDDDCAGLETCTPAASGSYYDDLIGYCD